MPIKAIARLLGISRSVVKAGLASEAHPRDVRASLGSIVDEVELRLNELLRLGRTCRRR